MAETLTEIETLETKKNEKLCELGNLISQYEAGVRDTLNADEYPTWVTITEMLKSAEIDEDIFDGFISAPEKFKIENGKIVFNENWEADLKQKEEERINRLHITKLDFYNNFCKPVGISYADLVAKIKELDMEADWELCNHVYYGVIKPFLDTMPLKKTEAEMILLFEKLCNKE